eukprot:PhM_4_TR10051/c0_g1_i2/m.55207
MPPKKPEVHAEAEKIIPKEVLYFQEANVVAFPLQHQDIFETNNSPDSMAGTATATTKAHQSRPAAQQQQQKFDPVERPSGRAFHAAVMTSDEDESGTPSFYVFGGLTVKEQQQQQRQKLGFSHFDDVWNGTVVSLEENTIAWQQLHVDGNARPKGLCQAQGVWANGTLHIIGGWDGKKRTNAVTALTTAFDDSTSLEWSEITPETAAAVSGHTTSRTAAADSAGTEEPTATTTRPTTATTFQMPPISFHSCCVRPSDGSVYVFGGVTGAGVSNDVYQFNAHDGTWTHVSVSGTAPKKRSSCAAAVHGEKMFVFGGRSEDGKPLNDLAVFDFQHHMWMTPKVDGMAPPARQGHSMCFVDRRLLIFGGLSGETSLCDVYVLDTVPNASGALTWLHPNVENPNKETWSPAPRHGHACFPLGPKVLIFGGRGDDMTKFYQDSFFIDVSSMYVGLADDDEDTSAVPESRGVSR